MDDTQARISVGRKEINRFGDKSVTDALKRLPGVTVTLSPTGAADIRLRGLGNGYTQYLLNGSPLPGGVTLESIPVETIERIEVLRSTSVESGAQGIAGSINIVTRKRTGSSKSGDAKMHLGSTNGGSTVGATLKVGRADETGQVDVALSAERTDTAPFSSLFEEERDATGALTSRRDGFRDYHYRSETISITPSARWTLDGATVALDGALSRGQLTGSQVEDVRASLGENLQYPRTDLSLAVRTTSLRANAELERNFETGGRFSSKVGFVSVQRHSDASLDGLDEKESLALQRSVHSPARDTTLSSTGKYTHAVDDRLGLSAGWDVAVAKRVEQRLQADRLVQTAEEQTSDEDYVSKTRRLATYVQSEWALTKNMDTYWGVRWEGLETESDGDLLRPVRTHSSVVSPVVQSVFRRDGDVNQQLRVALARTYKAPSTSDLMPRRFVAKNNSAVMPNYQGNPDLRPELAWALDLAVEAGAPKSGQASAAVYYRRIDNVTRLELLEAGGTWINRPFNGGKASSWGLELDGAAPFAAVPGLTLRGNLTWNDSRVHGLPGPHNRINEQVPLSLNVGFDLAPAKVPWGAGINLGFQKGGRYQVSEHLLYSTGDAISASGYALWKFDSWDFRASASRSNVQSEDRFYADGLGSLRQFISSRDTWLIRLQLEMPF